MQSKPAVEQNKNINETTRKLPRSFFLSVQGTIQGCRTKVTTRRSSADEIANVNFF